jgi:hypothetical protein
MLSLFALLSESALVSNLVRMESSVNVFSSSKWTKLQSHELKDDHVIQAIFVLQYDSAEIEALEQIFHDVSNPASENYGKWLEVLRIAMMLYVLVDGLYILNYDEFDSHFIYSHISC